MSGDTVPVLKFLGETDAAACVDGACAIPQKPGVSMTADAADNAGIAPAHSAAPTDSR